MNKNLLLINFIIVAGLLGIMSALPYFVSTYYIYIMTTFLINAILITSFRLIVLTGEWSFAHVAIMGLGAYVTAIITTQFGWPFWASLFGGSIASATFALILSYPLLRTKGFYFFLGSFAAGEILRQSWIRFDSVFGGFFGIGNIPSPKFWGINFAGVNAYYFLTLTITLVCIAIMFLIEKSRIGATFKGLSMNEPLARSLGVNTVRYRILAFVIGSFFAGVAGVLFAYSMRAIEPGMFIFTYNLNIATWVIVGGVSTFAGPFMGLAILTALSEWLHTISGLEKLIPLVFGFILIIALLFLPEGIISLPKRISLIVQNRLKPLIRTISHGAIRS